MRIVFIDEAGYCFNWKANLGDQPYYVLSAVCFPLAEIRLIYDNIRNEIKNMGLRTRDASRPLGQGFEIKAYDIVHGRGYWQNHNDKRNAVRNLMLQTPARQGGTAFVVAIKKRVHMRKYIRPVSPYKLALQFIFERLQQYLTDVEDNAFVIYDQNKRYEDILQNEMATLVREGSELYYFSKLLGDLVIKNFEISRIIEFAVAQSHNSVGLQVADFFATMTYNYLKKGKPARCGWWKLLRSSLYKKGNKLHGIGYKEFP